VNGAVGTQAHAGPDPAATGGRLPAEELSDCLVCIADRPVLRIDGSEEGKPRFNCRQQESGYVGV
jgi:hypothetical protein